MSDVAAIGIKIETDSIDKGIKSLDVLAQQGPKVESSMRGVEASTKQAAKSLADLGVGKADGLKSVGEAGKRAAEGLKTMGEASKGAATDAASVSRAMAEMTKQEEAYIRALTNQVQALRLSKSEFAAYKAQLMGYSQGTQDIARALGAQVDALKSHASASDVALGSITRLVSGGIQAFVGSRLVSYTLEAAKAMYDASAQAQRLQTTLNFATGGNGAREMEQIRQTANNLGLAFGDTAKAYAQFQAAARGTALEGAKARDVFESVAKASAVLGLSASDTSGVLLALQQMISKGTVQSEELRGQLGERLPGAFQSAARAMGVTTAELGKMLEQGQVIADDFLPKFAAQLEKDFGGAAEKAADRLDGAVNRWENAWGRLKQAGGDSGVSNVMADQYNSYAYGLDAMAASMERARKEGSGFWGQMGAAVDTAYKLGDRTQVVTVNMYENAKATAAAEKQLAELQKRAEIEGRGLFYQYQFDNLTKLIARLKEAKVAFDNLQAKSVAPDAAQMFNADEVEVANGYQKQVEKTAQIEAKLTEARMRAAGINKKYLEDLTAYKSALDNGQLSLDGYKAAVVDLIKNQWESSKAGQAEAEAKREAEAASRKAEAAVRKESTAYANLLAQVNQVIAKNKEEIDGRKHLSESQKLEIALTEALKAGKKSITAAHEAELRARIAIAREQDKLILQTKREVDAYKARVEVQDEANKAYAKQYDEVTKVRLAIDELRKATDNDTKRLQLEASLIGATNVQRQIAVQLYDLQIEKAKELDRVGKADYLGTPAQAREARAEAEANVEKIYAQKAANIAGKAYLDEWQRTVDQVETWFVDSFTRMLTDGKDGWESFCKSLKNSFLTLVVREIYRAFAQPLVVNLVGNLVGMLGGGGGSAAQALAGGGGGALGMVSNGYSLWNSFGGGFTAGIGSTISQIGTMIGSTAATEFGAGIAGATLAPGLAGPTTAGATGAMGIGAQIAPYLPWIAGGIAVLSLLGSGMFSTRGPNHSGMAYSTSGASREDTARQLTAQYGWKDPYEDFTVRGNTDKEANKQFQQTIDGLMDMYKALGKVARGPVRDIDVSAGFVTNPKYKDEASYGYFQILDKATGELLKSYANRDMSADGQKAWTQYVADLGKGMIDQLKDADIPSWMDKILADLGDSPTFEGLNAAVAQILAIDAAFKTWADNIIGFTGLTDKLQQALLDAAGGIDKLTAAVNTYYANFYSPEEQIENQRKAVRKQLSDLGIDLDPSSEGAKAKLRKMVEDALAAGNMELAYKLMALSGAFAQVADAAENAKNKTEEEAKAKAEQAKRDAEEAKKNAWDAAMRNLDAAIGREKEYWNQFSNDAKDALSKASSYFDLFSNAAKSLRDSISDVATMQAAAGMVFIENALENARRGMGMPDLDKSKAAIDAARGGLVMSNYATQAELDYDKKVLAGQLSELGDYADFAKTDAQKQIDLATSQLKRLDDIQTFWKDYGKEQIDATLSVTDAINALYKLLDPQEQAKLKAEQNAKGVGSTGRVDWGGAALGGTVAGSGGRPTVTGYTADGRAIWSNGEISEYGAGQNVYDPASGVNRNNNGLSAEQWEKLKNGGSPYNNGDRYEWDEATKTYRKVGSFDVGTNWVPRDQFARIHEGERIVPKADNQALIAALSNQGGESRGMAQVVAELQAVKKELQELKSGQAIGNEHARTTARTLTEVTDGGNAMRQVAM